MTLLVIVMGVIVITASMSMSMVANSVFTSIVFLMIVIMLVVVIMLVLMMMLVFVIMLVFVSVSINFFILNFSFGMNMPVVMREHVRNKI